MATEGVEGSSNTEPTPGPGDETSADNPAAKEPAPYDAGVTAANGSSNPVDAFRESAYPDTSGKTAPTVAAGSDKVPNDDQITHLDNYPPGSTPEEGGDKIQFRSDGTAVIWSKDPDKDPNTEGGTYGANGFVDQKGGVHYFNDEQYDQVNGAKNTAGQVADTTFKYQTGGNASSGQLPGKA